MPSKKKNGLSSKLNQLRAQKRRALTICILGAAAVVLVTVVRQVLGMTGVAPFGNSPVDTVMFVLCLGICFIVGPQFSLYLKLKREAREVEEKLAK